MKLSKAMKTALGTVFQASTGRGASGTKASSISIRTYEALVARGLIFRFWDARCGPRLKVTNKGKRLASQLLAVGLMLMLVSCVSVKAYDDGSLESISTKGTASVTLEVDDQLNIKKVDATSDGKNAVPILGGLFEAIQDLGGRFLGGGGSTIINVTDEKEDPSS